MNPFQSTKTPLTSQTQSSSGGYAPNVNNPIAQAGKVLGNVGNSIANVNQKVVDASGILKGQLGQSIINSATPQTGTTTSTGVANHTKQSLLSNGSQVSSSTSTVPPAQKYTPTGINVGINPYDINSITGNKSPAISTSVTDTPNASDVQNSNGLNVPSSTNNPGVQGSLYATTDSYMTIPTGYTKDATGNLVPNPDPNAVDTTGRTQILNRVLADTDTLGTKGDATNKLNTQYGVDDKQQSQIDAYNAYQQKKVAYQNIENNYLNSNQGIQDAASKSQFDVMQRNNNADLANLATIATAAQGNLTGALDIVKRKIDAEFDPIQTEVDNLSKFITTNNDNLSASDKVQLENQRFQLQTNLDLLKTAKTSAHQFALQQGITDPQVLNSIDAATSPSDAYQAVGMSGDGSVPDQGSGEQSLSQTSAQYVDHSSDGIPYVDQTRLDNMTPYQKQIASAEYAKAGIRVLDPADVSALGTIDGAKQDLSLFADTANNLLSSGFFGRIKGYTTNQLSQLTQSDPQWRQFQTLRTGLIKAVQGVASGAPGLRVTGAELSNAAESLPNSFDNKESAQQAIQTFSQLLNVNRNVLLRGNAPQESSSTGGSGLYDF